ncbi:MAG: ATP-grasp domain-containing protein [Pseudonocardiales bacterium]
MTPDQPLLLVIGTGSREFREYLLSSIGTSYRVHVFLGAEPTWQRDHICAWTVIPGMDEETIDAEKMSSAATALTGREPVHGVMSWDEARVLQVAKVGAALGLPGGNPAAAMRCRDKHQTREALAAADLPQPQSILIKGADEALAAAERIGYPVVLKPRAQAGSLGVVRVDTPEELTMLFAFARGTTMAGAWHDDVERLVEEYLDAPEVSIDSAVHTGQVFPFCVARKGLGYPPYFEEVGHVVHGTDPLLTDPDIQSSLERIHSALGFTDGMTHVEAKVTPRGLEVIEVNGRLGGDMIPYLGLRARGIDPGLAAAAVACGRLPSLQPDRQLVAAVRFFYVEQDDTTIGSIGFADAPLPAAVDRRVTLVAPGAVVSPPPKGILFGRIAYATAVADTDQECQAALDAAEATLRVAPAGAAVGVGA